MVRGDLRIRDNAILMMRIRDSVFHLVEGENDSVFQRFSELHQNDYGVFFFLQKIKFISIY
jgi:hypothetical protein